VSARHARNRSEAETGTAFARIGAGPATNPAPGQVVLVPGAQVPVIALDLPVGVRGVQRERIATRALRDLTGLDPARIDMRPLPGPRPQAWSRVLVTDPARLADWRARSAGARALLPDYLSLPAAEGLWTLQHRAPETDDADGEILARLGTDDGFTIETAAARLMLAAALREAPPRAVLWIGTPLPDLAALFEAAELPQIDRAEDAARHGLATPSVLGHGEESCDLRQDPGQERDHLRRRLLPWRWPALAAAAALAVWCTALVLETRQLRKRTATVTAQTLEMTRQHFIPAGPILDIRAQIGAEMASRQVRLGVARDQRSGLDLMNRAAALIDLAEATGVDDLSYTADGGLVARLRVPDYAAQDRLAETLSAGGLAVEVIESGLSEDGAEVRVEIALALAEGGQ